MRVDNLLLLPHLLARHTKGKEPLINYSQSHVVTSFEYLDIIRTKTMEKIVVEEIKTNKRKEKENRQAKQTIELGSTTK
jgi:hypothetical protein